MLAPEEEDSVEYGWIFRALALISICSVVYCEAKEPSSSVRAYVASYLMPEDHPIKAPLDSLFASSRVIFSMDTLVKAGFRKTAPRKFTKLLVTSHPAFQGYIFKLYLDVQRFHKDLHEYTFWVMRCRGAEKIREQIQEHGLGSMFKVPRKWIYALPKKPAPPEGYYTKYYILVEEDMGVVSDRENESLWASDYVTPDLLDGLYHILRSVGLHDCIKPDNIPFSSDGKVAFIDTQTFDAKVEFGEFTRCLSPANQVYWRAITHAH